MSKFMAVGKSEWNSVREILNSLPFEHILSGDIDHQASRLNDILTELQMKYRPTQSPYR